MFDYLLKGGKVINGKDSCFKKIDIGIKGSRIAKLDGSEGIEESRAREIIDAKGLIITPGFIDIHSHDDFSFWNDPYIEGKLRQGVTTLLVGNCGTSAAPIPERESQPFKDYRLAQKGRTSGNYPWTAKSIGEYLDELKEIKPAINVLTAVGHGAVRIAVLGFEKRCPSDNEMREMKSLVRQSLEEGAVGLSTGLIYPPGCYSDTEELIELAKEVKAKNGIYLSHIRSESKNMDKALREAILIGRSAGIPVEISHFKCLGKSSWGQAEKRLALLRQAREEGIEVSCDQYPYEANSTKLIQLLSPEEHKKGVGNLIDNLKKDEFRNKLRSNIAKKSTNWENFLYEAGGWDRVMISQAPGSEEYEGRFVSKIAKDENKDPYDLVFDIIISTKGSATMITFSMNENDIKEIMKFPWTSIGSDGMPGNGKVHPRYYGTFPRIFAEYVRDKKVLNIYQAVKKMTSLPASILKIDDRGIIEEGKRADLVLFDLEKIEDKATYKNPAQYPEGIPHVMVGGQFVLRDGELTGSRPGMVGIK